MSNLADIVQVNIDLNSPAVDSTSFDNLLLVGPPPQKVVEKAPPIMGVYSSLEEVNSAGWVSVGDNADPIGMAAMVAFAQSPQPSAVYIAVQQTSQETGKEAELEHPVDTLSRALSYSGWYVICPAGIPESQFEDMAQWTEAQTKLFAYTYLSDKDPVGSVYYRAMGWYGKENKAQQDEEIPPANKYLHIAAVADCLAYASGSETWAFKSLASVYPATLNSSDMKALKESNINFYTTYAGKNITINGKVKAGEWIDVIRFRDWLQNDMQMRILNLLLMNSKIPYTNSGIGLVENQMIASLKAGVEAGGIAPDEYDTDGALIPGYTVTVPNSASLTAAQKASRELTGCQFKARIAGAIHAVEVNGSLTYTY